MAKQKAPTQGGARKGAGRKPNAEKGLETRTAHVKVSFTASEYAVLEALAERDGQEVAVWVRSAVLAARAVR